MDMSKPYMTSFGIPIIAKFDNCTEEEFKKSLSEKPFDIKLSEFPSVQKMVSKGQAS